MEFTSLGTSSLVVSRLGLGCEQLGGFDWGTVDQEQGIAAVRCAVDNGVNLFDTSDVYGLGRSETLLSRALGDFRKEAVVVTKFGITWMDPKAGKRAVTARDCRGPAIKAALEKSLRRLRIETIPLYLVHWPDSRTPICETMETLLECQSQGKVRYFGVSNFSLDLAKEAHERGPLAAIQFPYSMINKESDRDLIPWCVEAQVGTIAYGLLGQGLLSGKYHEDYTFGSNDRRHRLSQFQGSEYVKNLKSVGILRSVARRMSCEPAQIAISWAFDNPALDCAVVGAKNPEQVLSNLSSLDCVLDPEALESLSCA